MRKLLVPESRKSHFAISVAQVKKKLINRAKKSGIYENFGQNEYIKLYDTWSNSPHYDPKIMLEFFQWIISYTGEE